MTYIHFIYLLQIKIIVIIIGYNSIYKKEILQN